MSQITTHVLDAAFGIPARGVTVALQKRSREGWSAVGKGRTDDDGRIPELGPKNAEAGVYRLIFATGDYFAQSGRRTFYPEVEVLFEVSGPEHYHVPLLLSPFAYSTYRGS
jgi:5-hydroxyisourate hydrolase